MRAPPKNAKTPAELEAELAYYRRQLATTTSPSRILKAQAAIARREAQLKVAVTLQRRTEER
jgi:hypothetical protein